MDDSLCRAKKLEFVQNSARMQDNQNVGKNMVRCRICNDDLFTQREFALHQVSSAHIKRVKRDYFPRGFSAVCLICKCALSNLKHVEIHLQEPGHKQRMTSFLVDSFITSDKLTCNTCAISFSNKIAFEVHHTMPSHGSTQQSLELSKLDELFKLLSGMRENSPEQSYEPLCIICNEKFNGLDDLVLHLLSPAHISRLKSSSCIVCKRDFIHASDREAHLMGAKHRSMMEKNTRLPLEEGQNQVSLRRGGYMCMFCMVWCNSWYCLELHLLDSHHSKVCSERKAKQPATFNKSLARELRCQDTSGEELQCQDIFDCDDSAIANWKKWKEESGLSVWCVWCHKCGVILSGPDAADIHIQDHRLERSRLVGKSHPPKAVHLSPSPGVLECACCTLSFKSAFSLMVHEAGFEHHWRTAKAYYTDGPGWCAVCGLLMDTAVAPCRKVNGLVLPNELALKTSGKCPAQLTRTTSQTMDSSQVDINYQYMVCEQRKHENHLEEGELPIIEYSTKVTADPDRPSCGPILGQESIKGNGSSKGLVEDGTSIEPGLCSPSQSDKIELTVVNTGHQSEACLTNIPAVPAQVPINSGDGRSQDHMPQGPSLLTSEFPDVSCSEVHTSSVDTRAADFGIPMVVAATVAPLGSLQESLQSIMTIVTEALSATLPMCTERPIALLKSKRHEHNGNDKNDQRVLKRMRLLEAALHQGLQSVCSNSTVKEDLDVKGSPQEDKLVSEDSRTELANRKKKCCGAGTADHAAQCTSRTQIVHSSVDEFVASVSGCLNERAVFAVAASVMENSSGSFAEPVGANSQGVVVPLAKEEVELRNIGLSVQEGKDDCPKVDVGNNILACEETHGVPLYASLTADQGLAEKRILNLGESLSTLQAIHCEPSSSFAFKKCAMEKEASAIKMSSCPVPDSDGFNDNTLSLPEVHKQLVQNPAGSEVGMPYDHSGDSDGTEDSCDYLAQLQYLKDHGYENWSSPSTDSESGVCK